MERYRVILATLASKSYDSVNWKLRLARARVNSAIPMHNSLQSRERQMIFTDNFLGFFSKYVINIINPSAKLPDFLASEFYGLLSWRYRCTIIIASARATGLARVERNKSGGEFVTNSDGRKRWAAQFLEVPHLSGWEMYLLKNESALWSEASENPTFAHFGRNLGKNYASEICKIVFFVTVLRIWTSA